MRHTRQHLIASVALALLLLAAALPLAGRPAPAAAQVTDTAGDSFGSAVPCLTAADAFAVTCFADTIYHAAPPGDPAAVQVGLSTKAPLAAVGTSSGAGARVSGGIGSIYGLAYDDGAISGAPRLFMAAFLKRLSSFGQGGPGGVYAYDLARRAGGAAPLFVVPDAGWDRAAGAADPTDRGAIPAVGRSGLGDMEISPDGRELFIVNLAARRIERYDITAADPVRRAPISIEGALDAVWAPLRAAGLASQEAAARADTVPFALEFSPLGAPGAPLLVLGLTDTARRAVRSAGADPPAGYPTLHLATYSLAAGAWSHSLTQDLNAPAIRDRMRDSQIAGLWASADSPSADNPYSARGLRGWNPWHDALATMPRTFVAGLNDVVIYPQPLLTDIEFSHDGRRMYLGLRDRTGDMVFAAEPPAGEHSAIAQGDTLVYNLRGAAWALETTARASDPVNLNGGSQSVRPAPSDVFDDGRHSFDLGIAPFHVENHGGALATTLQGDGHTIDERVATTTLLGGRRSAVAFYADGGDYWSSAPNVLVTASKHSGGKAAVLGDLEPLCTYAFVAGRVWHDVDGEGDQDPADPGLAGVTLEAFRGDSATAPALARATTDAHGAYRFALPPNTELRIRISAADRSAPAGAVSGYRLSPPNRAGGDDSRDSDASDVWGFVELAGRPGAPEAGETGVAIAAPVREQELAGVDIGLTRAPATGVIGDRVWVDYNGSGLQDSYGSVSPLPEPGLESGLLSLMSFTLVPDPNTAIIAPASAAVRLSDGRYEFRGLPPGRYAVRFGGLPAQHTVTGAAALGGTRDTSDSDAAPPGLTTRFVTLAAPTAASPSAHINRNLDLGLVPDIVDLAITLRATPSVMVQGGLVSYDIEVFHAGERPLPAADVRVTLQLPSGFTVDLGASAHPPSSTANTGAGQLLRWELGTLAPQAERTIRVAARNTTPLPYSYLGQIVSAAAEVSTSSRETALANNRAEASTMVIRPELALTKLGPPAVSVGDEFAYTLRVRNRGSAPAAGVDLEDPLPPGITFVRWQSQAPAGCAYRPASRAVRCDDLSLAAAGVRDVAFVVRAEPSAPALVTNQAILLGLPGSDEMVDNVAILATRVLRPDPAVEVSIVPDEREPAMPAAFPVGTAGSVRVRYGNGLAAPPAGEQRGVARAATLTLELAPGGHTLGALPAGCARAGARVSCALGDLAPGATGSLAFPVALPADYAGDTLQATATIATSSYESPEAQGDNTHATAADVVRPNVFVDAEGPAAIVGRGSVFWYTLDYGNLHRPAPALTRTAAGAVLRVVLPADVTLVQADAPPDTVDGRALTWELGDLAPRATGRIVIVVRTAADAGAALRLEAAISTATPGDSPADNADAVDTAVVQPPERIPEAAGELRLAISSELDPTRRDAAPDNGVYLTDGPRFAWPAGEIVELTPRLSRLTIPGEAELPYPYAYRARVVGWSLRAVTVDGRAHDPAGPDNRGRAGRRGGAPPAGRPQLLEGCAYGYVDGASIEAIRRAATPHEEQMRGQARIYWTRPPAPPLPDDTYLYAADNLADVRLAVQVEIELQIVNAAPGEVGGIPLPEVPVVPLPDPGRQLVAASFEVTLLVPRSVVGPGSP